MLMLIGGISSLMFYWLSQQDDTNKRQDAALLQFQDNRAEVVAEIVRSITAIDQRMSAMQQRFDRHEERITGRVGYLERQGRVERRSDYEIAP